MTISNSRQSYGDCYAAMDQALESEFGVRMRVPTLDAATFLRMRMHQARKINRKDNAATYERGHPMYGASAYDKLIVRIRTEEDGIYLYLEPVGLETGEIEVLDGKAEAKLFVDAVPKGPMKEMVVEAIKRRA